MDLWQNYLLQIYLWQNCLWQNCLWQNYPYTRRSAKAAPTSAAFNPKS